MSELQSQVSALRKTVLVASGLTQVASLFLTSAEAAKVDVSTVHEAAVDGLRILAQYDSKLLGFEAPSGILHSASVSVQRELRTREENDLIDKQISDLLLRLSLYASEPATHRVVEYLVRRYRAHEANAGALIKAFMHVHDTKVFARIVQLCTLEDSIWLFLDGVKRSGVPIARANIVKRCEKDPALLRVLCDHTRDVVKTAHTRSPLAEKGVQQVLAFFAAVALELAALAITSDHIRILHSFLLDGIQPPADAGLNPFRKPSCMIVAQLCRSTALAEPFLHSVLKKLLATLQEAVSPDSEEIALTVCIVLSFQKVTVPLPLLHLVFAGADRGKGFIRLLRDMSTKFNVQEAVTTLLTSLLAALAAAENAATVAQYLSLLLACDLASDGALHSVVRGTLSTLARQPSAAAVLAPLLRMCAQRFPEQFESALSESKAGPSWTAVKPLLQEAFLEAPYSLPTSSGASLLVALLSSSSAIRAEALDKFASVPADAPTTEELQGLSRAVCGCLRDDAAELAVLAWTPAVLARVASHAEPSLLAAVVDEVWKSWTQRLLRESTGAGEVILCILRCLADKAVLSSCTSDACVLPDGSAGVDWLTRLLSITSLGSLRRKYSGKSDDFISALAEIETAALDAIKAATVSVPLFSHIAKSTKKKTSAITVLSSCLIQSHEKDLAGFIVQIESLASCCMTTAESVSVCSLFVSALNLVGDSEESSGARAALLQQCVPLLEQILADSDADTAGSSEVSELASSVATRIGPSDSLADEDLSLTALTRSFAKDVAGKDLAFRLLLSTLRAASPSVVDVAGHILTSCYHSQSEYALLRVAYSASALVSDDMKAAAVCFLSSFVGSLNETSSVSSFVSYELKENISKSILLCIPLVIALNKSQNKWLRLAAVELLKSLTSCSKRLTIKMHLGKDNSSVSFKLALFMESLAAYLSDSTAQSERSLPVANKNVLVELVVQFQWSLPTYSLSTLEFLAPHTTLSDDWAIFESLFASSDKSSTRSETTLYTAVFRALHDDEDVDKTTLARIVTFLSQILTSRDDVRFVRQQLLLLFESRWALFSASAQQVEIFNSLVDAQKNAPGNADINRALRTVQVDLSTACASLRSECASLKAVWESSGAGDDSLEEGTSSEDLTVQTQVFCAVLEGLLAPMRESASDSVDACVSPILLDLFDVLAVLNNKRFNSILSTEYTKTLVFDLIITCLERGSPSLIQKLPSHSPNPKKKKKGETFPLLALYGEGRMVLDIAQVFLALEHSKSASLQLSAINALDGLLSASPSMIKGALLGLGKLLTNLSSESSFAKDGATSREGLIDDILNKLCSIVKKSSEKFIPQHVLQPLCFHFTELSSFRRGLLVKSAVEILGESSLPACVSVLLTHALVAYDPEVNVMGTEADNNESYILLSRSAQRKAHRELKSSKPEDIFRLALDFSLRKSGASQVSSLVAVLRAAHQFFGSIQRNARKDKSVSASSFESGASVVELTMLEEYAESVFDHVNHSHTRNMNGIRASLLLLHLEYVFETLESSSFHRALVSSTRKEDGLSLQSMFIEVAEEVLELIALVSESLHEREEDSFVQVSLQLGDSSFDITFAQIAQCTHDWGLNIFRSLQKLLDNPTFIAILQELLDHELMPVRQKAVQMLAERLAESNVKDRSIDSHLYIDLCNRLRGVLKDCGENMLSKSRDLAASSRGLMQSGVMCIDVLAKSLGRESVWSDVLVETLGELVSLSKSIVSIFDAAKSGSEESLEFLKLMGSLLLCCGSICSTIGPRCVSFLSDYIGIMMGMLTTQGKYMVKLSTKASARGEYADTLACRTMLLFLRSAISSICSVASGIPTFVHPYIHEIIVAILRIYKLENIADFSTLDSSIDRCFDILLSTMPPRLAIPSILSNVGDFLGQGHKQARRFAEYVGGLWMSLDRAALTSNVRDATSVVILCLDYRAVHREDSAASDATEECIIASTVEFCLKLTEAELKSLLLKLIEWKSASDAGDAVLAASRQLSRGTTFFQLTTALCTKLRGIFVPLLSYAWPSAVAGLEDMCALASRGKGSKKRKADEHDAAPADEGSRVEVICLSRWILSTIRAGCTYDSVDGFMDEERIVAILPKVSELLSKHALFETVEEYSSFMEDCVIPTLTAISSSVSSDVLWKPLNHKLLMLTRDKKKEVRAIAVKALHSLFHEIGEDYLLMLPECLPFLSELLEEENENVLALSVDFIKFIEGLSGEKLDQYLQ